MTRQNFNLAGELAQEIVVPHLQMVDVEPPTSASIELATQLGKTLEARSHAASDNLDHIDALGYIRTLFKNNGLDSDNFAALHDAACEASARRRYGDEALEGDNS
jgi:hypothetical protein